MCIIHILFKILNLQPARFKGMDFMEKYPPKKYKITLEISKN
jgi:hypothetical protein